MYINSIDRQTSAVPLSQTSTPSCGDVAAAAMAVWSWQVCVVAWRSYRLRERVPDVRPRRRSRSRSSSRRNSRTSHRSRSRSRDRRSRSPDRGSRSRGGWSRSRDRGRPMSSYRGRERDSAARFRTGRLSAGRERSRTTRSRSRSRSESKPHTRTSRWVLVHPVYNTIQHCVVMWDIDSWN